MKRALEFLLRIASTLVLFYSITKIWLSTPASEILWTSINSKIKNGAEPGLSSDIELIITMAIALPVAYGITSAIFNITKPFAEKKS